MRFARLCAFAGWLWAGLAAAAETPIVFVHGNGDHAGLWQTVIWRFEANGYDPGRLFAIDFPHPLARSDDTKPQPGRSSTEEQRGQLAAFVAEVKRRTGADKVALVGNSRGGNSIRNYVKNGGAAHVSHVVLGGAVNHGVFAASANTGSEFNGAGEFMTRLNAGPDEVAAGVAFLTLRSDSNDKYAQPEGRFIGQAGRPTGISYDAPALKGATNEVLPGLDHREVAYHWLAFERSYRFIVGRAPERLDIPDVERPILDGMVQGMPGGQPSNLPLAGAQVAVFAVDPATGQRLGPAVHAKTTAADGRWGPFAARSDAYYEFVVAAPGEAVTHIYRTPFPRSALYVNLRPGRLAEADKSAGSVVTITRPRGYFGHGRDRFTLDGQVPPGINEGVPGASTGTVRLPSGPLRGLKAEFNDERLTVLSWPAAENRVVFAEFHH
ncbi:MAG: hydrolase [Alphaproteobacteria bacterium]|nr:hydrolase [Alphaproteobacteria bacterium]